jgi:hypothetical protein
MWEKCQPIRVVMFAALELANIEFLSFMARETSVDFEDDCQMLMLLVGAAVLEARCSTHISLLRGHDGHLAALSRWDVCLAPLQAWLIQRDMGHHLTSLLQPCSHFLLDCHSLDLVCTSSLCKFKGPNAPPTL